MNTENNFEANNLEESTAATPTPEDNGISEVVNTTMTDAPMVDSPVVTESQVAMADDEMPTVKEPKGAHRYIFGLLGTLGVLMMIVVGGIFMLWTGGNENPLAQNLGLNLANDNDLLWITVALISGALSLVGLIMGIVGTFKLMNSNKDEAPNRKPMVLALLAGVLLLAIGVSGGLYSLQQIGKSSSGVGEIIVTNPAITTGLTAPVTITFAVGQLPLDENQYKVVAFNWSFGDGASGTGPTVTHTYQEKPASGVYTATLKVSYQEIGNLSGEILDMEWTKVIGIDNAQVSATFSYSPLEGQAPLEVTFDASESKDPDGFIVKYEWDFSDNGIFDTEGMKVSHTFVDPGSYPVTLKVTDNSGQSNTVSHIVTVKTNEIIAPLLKLMPADTFLKPGRAYQFDASESVSSEGKIVKFEWDFGNNKLVNGQKATHTFQNEGIYEVKVHLTDESGNTLTHSQNWTVSDSASGLFVSVNTIPAVGADNIVKGAVPLKVTFDASGSSGGDIIDYQWDFNNDGTVNASGQTAEHIFTDIGEYETVLQITTADKRVAKKSIKVIVTGGAYQASMTANPLNGTVPLTVTFDATSSQVLRGETIIAFRWDFGDGTPLVTTDSPIITHRFNSVGTFKVKLITVTNTNKSSETETNIVVTSIPLQACYTMSRKVGPAPLSVSFNPQCSTGTVSSYRWTFANLGVSNDRRPTFTFNDKGSYEIILEIVDNKNNVSVFKDSVTVN